MTEPESGLTTYAYAYNSTGLVVTRKRPKANQTSASTYTTTTTQFDSVNRPLTVTYSDGTPERIFSYDQAVGWNGTSQPNMKGRLSEASRTTSGGLDATLFGYDTMGRVTNQYNCTPSYCGSGYYSVLYSYNWAGMLTSEGDGANDTYTYGRSLAGEITGITSSFSDSTDPANIIVPGSITNGVFGPSSYQLGSGLETIRTYDSLGRNNNGWLCSGSTQTYCKGGTQLYGYGATYSGTRTTGTCDTVLNTCNNFGYDEFNRLTTKTVTSGSGPGLSFTYDRFGNRWTQSVTSGSAPSPSFTFSQTNNQMSGYSYDALGNLLNDGYHSYTYDADNNVISVDTGSTAKYYFDALNQRVAVVRGGSGGSYEFVFDANGRRVSTWIAGTHAFSQALVYSDTQPLAFRAGGSMHFQHQDYLGTARINTGYSGSTEGSFASLPFGDNYTVSGEDWDWYHFGETDHDPESSTEHAMFRQYSSTAGRWMSPDPYYGSYRVNNPQSFNRYSYARNNPLSAIDPAGLDEDSDPCDDVVCYNGGDPSGGDPVDGNGCDADACVTTNPGCEADACVTTDPPEDPDLLPPSIYVLNNLVPQNPCTQAGNAPDPSHWAQAGAAQRYNPFVSGHLTGQLMQFKRGGPLDAQPLGASQAYGNYVYGVFMRSAGFNLSITLWGANYYAGGGAGDGTAQYSGPVDPNYPNIPSANVANITAGYMAQKTGTVCHVP